MEIRPLKEKDLASVASLHLDYLPSKFCKCKYSLKLFQYFYNSFINSKNDIALVIDIEGHVVGYICIITSLNKLYITAIKNRHVYLLYNLIALLILQHDRIVRDMFNRLHNLLSYRTSKSIHSHTDTINDYNMKELRPIVVRADYQGSIAADTLLNHAEERLKILGESKYFLRVHQYNLRAINFYRRVGFKVVGSEAEDILIMEKNLS